jgi:hypothetical protein
LLAGGPALVAAALADPLAVVAPLPPGTYPVGCSNVEQDFSRVQPGESAQQYWEGYPTGNQERYVAQLLTDPADVLRAGIAIPDDRELFVDRATSAVEYEFRRARTTRIRPIRCRRETPCRTCSAAPTRRCGPTRRLAGRCCFSRTDSGAAR